MTAIRRRSHMTQSSHACTDTAVSAYSSDDRIDAGTKHASSE